MNYSHLTSVVFGPIVSQILNVCICLSGMGSLLSYLNVIGSLGSSLMRQLIGSSSFISSYSGFIVCISIMISPLLLFRSYGDLTIISFASLSFIVLIVIFVAIEGQIEAMNSAKMGFTEKVKIFLSFSY